MRLLVSLFAIGLIVAVSVQAGAEEATVPTKTAKTARKAKKTKAKAAKSELQTDVKFDDSVLHGQYQTPEEALAKVENEKGLSDLLGVRKHFKDRLTTAAEQE